MKPTYRQLLAMLNDQPLALMPSRIEQLTATLAGVDLDTAVADDLAATVRANPQAQGSVAVIPLVGMTQKREDIWTRYGFAVSMDAFVRQVQQAVNDPGIKAVIFDVDSPGGLADGCQEASDAIRGMRGSKPIVAVANTLMASAAYHVGCAADEVVGSPSSGIGSIGVWTMHVDASKMYADAGINVTLISAGKYKVLGNEFEPLTDEAKARIQSRIDQRYDLFVNSVAKNRGVTAAAVRVGYGEGEVLLASDAKAAGLIDRVATLDETIRRFAGGSSGSGARADSGEGGDVEAAATVPNGESARQRERERLALAG